MYMMVGPMRFNMSAVINFGGKYIYQDNHMDTKYNRICSNQMDRTMKEFILKKIAIWCSFVCYNFYPTYVLFAYGTKTTTTELHWPFFEPKSNGEYLCNFGMQVTIGAHAILLYFVNEIYLSLMANVVTITPYLIECDFEETERLIKTNSMSKLKLYCRIRNITIQCLDSIA